MSWLDESDAKILFEEGLGPDPDGEPGCCGCMGLVFTIVILWFGFLLLLHWN